MSSSCVNKTLSFDKVAVTQLDELNKKTMLNKSKLVRLFIKYFYENEKNLKEILNRD